MAELILTVLKYSVILAIPASMMVLSMESEKPYLKVLYNNPKMMLRYFLVMFVLVPALALALYYFDIDNRQTWLAVLVISLSPASPGMLKSLNKINGDTKISIAWMITAILLSVIMLPVNLFIIDRFIKFKIDLGIDDVMIKLFIMFLLPMIVGFMISKFIPKAVPGLKKILGLISKVASITLIICVLIIAVPVLMNKSLVSMGLILAFLIITLGLSLLFELPKEKYGPILAYSVVLRLPAPALVLASINGMTKVYAPEIITFLLLGIILMMIYSKAFYGKKKVVN
ncbi:MAG: hypothetical protein IPG78_16385 [Ignavibacteria bacterium]|nr:hypothetical protein [Ignavibacteria bacterium]